MKENRPFSHEDWLATPKPVRDYIEQLESMVQHLMDQVEALKNRVEKLENQLNKNSRNSSKPPSSDSPYKKPRKKTLKAKGKKRKKADKKAIQVTSRNFYLPIMNFSSCQDNAHVAATPLTSRILNLSYPSGD